MSYIFSFVFPAGNESSIATIWEFAGEFGLLIVSTLAAFGLVGGDRRRSRAQRPRNVAIFCAVLAVLVIIGAVGELIY